MKVSYDLMVNTVHSNKYNEEYKIIKYLGAINKKHSFDIEFIGTKHIQLATYQQIKSGTIRDLEQRKKLKRLETEEKLRERNRLIKQNKNKFYFPQDMKDKRLLAIDLSTTSTGIAYANKGKVLRWKTVLSANKDARERAYEMAQYLVKVLEKGKFDAVIIEDVYLGLNSKILIMLSEARGMLFYHLQRLGIELYILPAVLWKARFKDCPVLRDEQKKFMMEKFFEYTGVEADSDDAADAYMMLKACLEWEGKDE